MEDLGISFCENVSWAGVSSLYLSIFKLQLAALNIDNRVSVNFSVGYFRQPARRGIPSAKPFLVWCCKRPISMPLNNQ